MNHSAVAYQCSVGEIRFPRVVAIGFICYISSSDRLYIQIQYGNSLCSSLVVTCTQEHCS